MIDVFWIYVTTTDAAEAEHLSKAVVEERLAACANIIGPIKSVYRWKGEICEGSETAVVLKTSAEKKQALIERIGALHGYENPCIAALPIVGGSKSFLQWIAAETGASSP